MLKKLAAWFEPVATVVLILLILLVLVAGMAVILQSFDVVAVDGVAEILALTEHSEVLKLLGIGLGGLVLMLQALIANKRARAMERTARAQANAAASQAEANENTEKGQRQERLKNAIEHLGSDSESVRLGGTYELVHLAQDTNSLRQSILNILCSHIRRTTKEEMYQKEHPWKPSEEIQSLLTLLFVEQKDVFAGLRVDLNGSHLNGADLREAQLCEANLRRTNLNKALLDNARLESVRLTEAYLKEARLGNANLREAQLFMAHMQGVYLEDARLQGANLMDAKLTSAWLRGAQLQGAFLFNSTMHGATLSSAMMQGARLSWAYLQGCFLDDTNFEGAGDHHWEVASSFSERIRFSVGKQSDLSKVVDGGMTRERVEQLVEEVLCQDKREPLRQQLRSYINGPNRFGLPEGHRAVVGTYQACEADKWITEHDAHMRTIRDMQEKATRVQYV